MQCIITVKQPNQFTNCDETKKRTLNTHTVRAKEKPRLIHGGPSLVQSSSTNAAGNILNKAPDSI